MKIINFIFFTLIALALLALPSCREPVDNNNIFDNIESVQFSSFRDIPGITQEEIAAIEELQRQNRTFIFSVPHNTEAYIDINGEISGFTPFFCDWMGELFEINIQIEFHNIGETLSKLVTGEVDFSFLAVSEERSSLYSMSGPIIHRSVKIMRLQGSRPLHDIAYSRTKRYAVIEGSRAINALAFLDPASFEIFTAGDYETLYRMLENGVADGVIAYNTAEAAFDPFGGVAVKDFLPLIVDSVSLASGSTELSPLISGLTKALNGGAHNHLTNLYRQGYQDYRRNKFLSQLTDEEIMYIQNNPVIPFVSQHMSYPVSFFDRRKGTWNGIVYDIMEELEKLTGLEFVQRNEPGPDQIELMNALENETAFFMPNLILTDARRDRFLWLNTIYQEDEFALLSKYNYPNVELNDIPFEIIGLSRGSAHADMFRMWFPNALHITEYSDNDALFSALNRGEINLAMSSKNRLTALTNYFELSDYKANFIFNAAFEGTFAFNKNHDLLRSIIDKTFPLIDTEKISDQWLSRTYNIETMRLRGQRPWLISAIILSGCIIILILVLFIISMRSRQELNEMVKSHSSTIKTIFDASPDIIFCKDTDLRYTKCNRSMEKHIGRYEAEIVGKTNEEAQVFPADAAKIIKEVEEKILIDKKEASYEGNIPSADGPSADGEEAVFEIIKAPVFQEGKLTGIMGIARDITLRKEAEKKAAAASVAKSRFLANMSHEIRTPMNSIIGFSELAQNNDNPPKTSEYLVKIHENAKLLLVIINDVLDISKIESGKMELENIPFDLHDVFSYCQSAILKKANEKGIALHCYAEPVIEKKILGDPVRLRQVLLNILSNAVKFTDSGIINISASVISQGEFHVTIRFEVRDTGVGMTAGQITRIFEPFTQADTSITRKYGGTGLGLAITKNIIEMMGGTLQVESTPGEGSKFSFELSFDYVTEHHENQYIDNELNENELPVFSGEILVCEDNKMNQQVISDHLERLGIKAVIAENGLEGIEKIEKRLENKEPLFDLIFMDIHMPVMDGLKALSIIKEMGINTPIIAMTANLMKDDLEIYKKSGMDDRLGKPFTADELIALLKKYFTPADLMYVSKAAEDEMQEKMLKALRLNFYKNNQTMFADIVKAIEDGDIKLAHRMAHTLKGNAGQIGEKDLQKAAASAEKMLSEDELPPKEKIAFLENEIKTVLDKLSHTVSLPEIHIKTKDKQEVFDLFSKLEPMLKNNNPECMYFADELASIEGTEDLIRYIENFDFNLACNELNKIKRNWMPS